MMMWRVLSLFVVGFVVPPTPHALEVPKLTFTEQSQYVNEGDINLGALLPINAADPAGFCSDTYRSTLLLPFIESIVYGVKEINKRQDVLPNITLGFVIMDDCARDMASLARSVYFVPNRNKVLLKSLGYGNQTGHRHYNVAGVIGPTSSRRAVMGSSFLSIFEIPTVSPTATSDELSDKSRYKYFLRLVPADMYQAYCIADMLEHFNWTYVSVLYSEGAYGENGVKQIERRAKDRGICLAVAHRIPSDASQEEFEHAVKQLARNMKARVVVLYINDGHQSGLEAALMKENLNKYFIFVGSDYFQPDFFAKSLTGSFRLSLETLNYEPFRRYLFELNPDTNPDNPWMKVHWEKLFDCSWNVTEGERSCQSYTNMSDLQTVRNNVFAFIDSVSVYAHAIDYLVGEKCASAFQDKSHLDGCFNGEELLETLLTQTFPGLLRPIDFDERGDMVGQFEIHQYIGQGQYTPFALWDQKNMSLVYIDEGKIAWQHIHEKARLGNFTSDQASTYGTPESICSKPCQPKEYFIQKELHCCWECRSCRENEILIGNSTGCEPCETATWPDEFTSTECIRIPPTYMRITDGLALGLLFLGVLGLVGAVVTSIIFFINRQQKLIKASSKELSLLTMVGILAAYLTVLPFILPPMDITCHFGRHGFNLAVCLLYAPLLVKTNRIHRIFAAGKKGNKRPKFIGTKPTLVAVVILVLIQIILTVVSAIIAPPIAKLRMQVPTEKFVELFCDLPLDGLLAPLVYNILLILLCAMYGFLSRKLPENFNESWYIFISVCTTLFLWIVFLPTYFTQFYAYNQAAILAFCLIINATVTLICLYIPKIYAIYFVDEEKITIRAMTTNTTQVSALSEDNATK